MNMTEAIELSEEACKLANDTGTYKAPLPDTVYMVMKEAGEYSAREVECFMGFYNEEAAKGYVEAITKEINEFYSTMMTDKKYKQRPEYNYVRADKTIEE